MCSSRLALWWLAAHSFIETEEYIVHYIGIITADWVSSNGKKHTLRSRILFLGSPFPVIANGFIFLHFSSRKKRENIEEERTMREKGNGHKPNVNSYDSAENEMCVCVCECGFLRFFENVETQVRKKGKM